MRIINQEHALVPVTDLQPHPRNPNHGNVEAIAESITSNGFYGAIVAQRRTGYILVGHHRYHAAVTSGAREIPVFWVDVDEHQALRILLADNRTAELAERDAEALAALLQELAGDDDGLTGTGYEQDDLDTLLAQINTNLPESFRALDESIAQDVKTCTCPACGHEFPA